MSKKINVNPDHYKVAGRERMGEKITQNEDKALFGMSRGSCRSREGSRNFIPGAAPVGQPGKNTKK